MIVNVNNTERSDIDRSFWLVIKSNFFLFIFFYFSRTFTQVSIQWQDSDSMREELDDLQVLDTTPKMLCCMCEQGL